MNGDAPAVTHDPDCDLCEAAQFTHWYYEDDICWIADCEVCSVPMVVWKNHSIEPPPEALAHMHEQLLDAGRTRFGGDVFEIDGNMRQIPDHFHAHARDSDWFRLRAARPMSRFTGVGEPRVER